MASLAEERRKKNYVNMNKTLEPLEFKPAAPFSKRAVSLGRSRKDPQTRNLKYDLQAAKAMF
jgi:hypothetical protein